MTKRLSLLFNFLYLPTELCRQKALEISARNLFEQVA
jgi:hypothetical protein